MLQQNRRYCRISSSVKDGPPSTLVDKDREREKNRINLNIVLRGQDDQDCSAVDGESLLSIGARRDLEKPRPGRSVGQLGFTGRKIVSDNKATVVGRPPLVRAMSAPSQNHSNRVSTGHFRKPQQPLPRRARKILPVKEEPTQPIATVRQSFTSVQIKEDDDDYSDAEQRAINNRLNSGGKSTEATSRKSSAKSRNNSGSSNRATTFTCDQIVTLVSLLDSGGSDSEREKSPERKLDGGQQRKEENLAEKPPTLRKAGKSVSFQEHANQNYPAVAKEFSLMFRRGSVAPLAARIRAQRPPTAPPGSVFIRDIDTSESTSSAYRMARRPAMDVSKATPVTEGNGGRIAVGTDNRVDDPEAFKTAKERECFKLFQKMTNRGITVSYDTILRGMLTPTELRLIQKQRELEQAQREAAEAALSEGQDKKP